jgi:hypothetical protein
LKCAEDKPSVPQNLCAIGASNQYLARTGAGETGKPANGGTQRRSVSVANFLETYVL